jgi:hypothetical protein
MRLESQRRRFPDRLDRRFHTAAASLVERSTWNCSPRTGGHFPPAETPDERSSEVTPCPAKKIVKEKGETLFQ